MKKKLIFALSMIVLFLVSTFTSYALFTFHSDSKVDGSIFTDPIKENYDFANSMHNSSDTYNIYFFPQARYASAGKIYDPSTDGALEEFASKYNKDTIKSYDPTTKTEKVEEYYISAKNAHSEGTSARKMFSYYGKYDGYFGDEISQDFHYKIATNEGTLSDDTLSKVGVPLCNMFDSRKFKVSFSGWTISQKKAIDLGYGGIGNFNLIESTSPFSYIDIIKADGTEATPKEIEEASKEQNPAIIKGIDGSNICDNEIFLYPIFTTGKDYKSDVLLDCIKIASPNEMKFLSLYKEKNDTAFHGNSYVARDLRIDSSSVTNVNFKMTLMLYYSNWGGNQWMDTGVDVNLTIKRVNGIDITDANPLPSDLTIPKLSNFNLIPKFNSLTDYNLNESRPGDYNIYVYTLNKYIQKDNWPNYDASYIPNELNTKKITDIYYFDNNSGFTDQIECKCWIYVEEKYDFKVLGGNITSFDYNNNTANICQPMDETGENFIANNVIFNNIEKKFTYKAINDGDTNYFKNGVFAILPVSTNPTYATTNPLDAIISDFKVRLSNDENTQKYCEFAKSKDDPNLVDDWDYDLNTDVMKNALDGKLLKIRDNGYFVITCKKILDNGEKILEVSVNKLVIPIFVAIYASKDDIMYDENMFVDFAKMQQNNKLPLYASDEIFHTKINGFKCLYLGDTIKPETTFAVKNTNNKYTTTTSVTAIYNDLNAKGLTLYEVTTNKPVLIGGEGVMLRNRVFYIGEKIK